MKKFLTAVTVSFLLVSCPRVGGEKIESNDTMLVLQQVMYDLGGQVVSGFNNVTEKNEDGDFVLDANGSVGNYTASSTLGVKARDKAVYNASLIDYQFSTKIWLTEKAVTDSLTGLSTEGVTVTVTGGVYVEDEVVSWGRTNASRYAEENMEIGNAGGKGLTVKVVKESDNSVVYEGEVFVSIKASVSTNAVSPALTDYSVKINGQEYVSPYEVWSSRNQLP